MKFTEILKRMFVERVCLICSEAISYDREEPFCEDCIDDWHEFLKVKCRQCGRTNKECICLPTKVRKINNSFAVWCVFYDAEQNGEVNKVFYYLKRQYDRATVDFCTDRMKKSLLILAKKHKMNYSDFVVTYAPRSHKNIIKHGFDQSQKLAKSLAKKLGIKCVCMFENVGKCEQKKLNKKERAYNAQMSYEYKEGSLMDYKKVILVDDIMTSGATLYACAFQLYKNGATTVVPVTFAKDNYVKKGGKGNVKRSTKHNFARAIKGFVRNGA